MTSSFMKTESNWGGIGADVAFVEKIVEYFLVI